MPIFSKRLKYLFQLKVINMAKPIEPTPTLEGKDAEDLLYELYHVSYSKSKEKFLKECLDIYHSIPFKK